MNVKYTRINAPLRKESIKLRLMIGTGVIAMIFFLYTLFTSGAGGFRPLYICLCITLFYMCLKYLHEWYHYFSISVPPEIKDTGEYTVDILTTFCPGEPYDMLDETLRAISEVRYPHTGWCCDEGDDPIVKEMCVKYGIRHVTRTIKKDAKAGNINNALQFATGDVCVILDPDHIPAPEFLDVVLPYFATPEVGYVQVVQAYKNHDESLIAKGAAQQTYQFYGPMMMSMHAYGTAQAIGANCTFRRAALDSIGGHAPGLAEDMHTAMRLHSKGWKSVYVPAVITRGLVPSTLEAYYKQQLKWSRGTFDLLFYTYPKLFKNFTVFQKIHYFLLPFHYLCGLISLLNFLIPVASLLMGESPLYMDLTSFLLALFPLTCICFLIRHYVQKWVVEETERGFHIVGGLLQIGTWWIHLTGFIYTIIRKKVPYIPTPKDDRDPTPFRLHIPNLFIIAISLFAIIYGLNRDWTPFSLVMAGFAMINIIVLSFVIYASYKKASYLKINMVFTAKKHLWLFRHWLYRFARENALILSCLIITGTISAYHDLNRVEDYSVASLPRDKVFYRGIFQPTSDNGITSVGNVFKNKKDSIQIVSFYVSWSDTSLYNIFPISEMEEVYKNNAIPLLTVDPWLSKKQVFKQITEGRYDSSIKNMARTLAHLNKPVFFRFAQEPENLHFPWSSTGGNTPQSFINAWRYMHDQFESAGASKVIWVYNPGNPQNVGQYFPGSEYVDWLGVNILNYNSQLQGQSSFEDLYRPFHNTAIFQQDLPVLLTEVGTLSGDKKNWWDSAWSMMDTAFSEIRGVVAYNNNFDHHGLNGYQEIPLQWSLPLESAFGYAFPAVPLNNSDFNDTLRVYPERSMTVKPLPENIHAVVYDKGYHWSRNIHTVSEKVLRFDIASMESMKINTIFRTIPGVYDKNVFSMCKMKGIRIIPMLSAELDPESMADKRLMEREKKRLIDIVDDYKDNPSVLAWNISNDVLSKLEGSYITPDLFFYKVRYLKWLQELVDGIKHIDPVHPVTLNISFDNSTNSRIKDYQTYIGNVDQFYVSAEIRDKDQAKEIIPTGNVAWGPVEPVLWDSLYGNKKFVIPNWQDQEASGFASLNGLFDFEGRKKITYYSVLKHWAIHSDEMDLSTEVKILKPAKLTFPGNKLTYYALTKNSSGQWAFAASQPNTIFEWYLVRTDEYGNPAYLKLAGSGVSYTLTVPYHPETYRLYLKVIKDNQVNGTLSTLNTPLN